MAETTPASKAAPKPGPSVQRYLDIAEIKDGAVVLKDGSMRAVLLVSSINFSLKSEDEQQAIINEYVAFLNSLDFPLQVVIQSRRLNIDSYIQRLSETEKTLTNELLRIQIADYRNFVQELVTIGQIMQKQFFVVVPYSATADKRKGFFERLSELFYPSYSVQLAEERFQRQKQDLYQRVDAVAGQLMSMGLKSAALDTQGLIELYYRAYNPELYDTEKMADVSKIRLRENQQTLP